MKPIFIAGPHGSGKTTLISKLIVKSDRFIKDDYEIDFSNDMETLSSMTIFEKMPDTLIPSILYCRIGN